MTAADVAQTREGRWRKVAVSFAKQAEAKLNSPTSRQRFTRRRAAIAAAMASDGFVLQDAARAAFRLADLWRRPPVPFPLGLVGSGKQLCEIMRGWDGGIETRHAEKVRELLKTERPPEDTQAAELADLLREIRGGARNIPGFFPTPPKLVDLMITCADIGPDVRSVLEPSAGIGSILDRLKERHPEIPAVVCVERVSQLCEVLQLKGYEPMNEDFLSIGTDFDAFDVVLMNPPFETGQDAVHVAHAFNALRPGGRLVAIVSEGLFYRDDRKAQAFRELLSENGQYVQELADAFNGPDAFVPTGVRTRLIVIDKPR